MPEQTPPSSGDALVAPDWRMRDALLGIARRLPRYLRLAWALVRDPRVPAPARRWLVAAGAYNLSPLDPIPGVIPVIGQLDDYAVLLLAIRKALRATAPELRHEHLAPLDLTESQVDADLQEIRRIVGHLGRRAVRGLWTGARFAAGVGLELGRQLLVGAARAVRPLSETPADSPAPQERRNPPIGVEPDASG